MTQNQLLVSNLSDAASLCKQRGRPSVKQIILELAFTAGNGLV